MRKNLEGLFLKMSEKLAALQQRDGSWHASLLDPESYPSKETSGTGFICYAMAWGMNNQLLPDKKYLPVLNKAWLALTTAVQPDGKLGYVQAQGAAPDKVGYDDTDVYGVGAFLLAGSEMLPLYLNHKEQVLIKEVHNGTAAPKKMLVTLNWSDVAKKIKKKKPKKILVRDGATGEFIPLVMTTVNELPQVLRFSVDVSSGTSRYFQISAQ
ncbi:hypothetical protein AQ505_15685 [Pedobacter sp. PACM 27299]|uniref:glycoside hydrolase family 88 protein n=1 Tax=Pedobacter sp. PACM 27299 TaxID=1727164 RepID=UPI0007065A89|nr:glycoside hydrolase family 88 protein [Pedobacter sp. PACM 27299]ALL06804.1 hypothetical protein AQ505_15685 [Pedobacter sp. PACM 27299]